MLTNIYIIFSVLFFLGLRVMIILLRSNILNNIKLDRHKPIMLFRRFEVLVIGLFSTNIRGAWFKGSPIIVYNNSSSLNLQANFTIPQQLIIVNSNSCYNAFYCYFNKELLGGNIFFCAFHDLQFLFALCEIFFSRISKNV